MNTVRTTARLEHSPPFAARCAFGTRNPLRRQRVIGGEGASARLENFGGCVTGKNPLCRPSSLGAAGLGFQKGVLLTGTGPRTRGSMVTGQGRRPADFSFSNHLANAGKHSVENGLQILHGASVASFVMDTSHHRRSRKWPKTVRSAASCLH